VGTIVVSVGEGTSRESLAGAAEGFVGIRDPLDEIPVDDIGFLLPNGFIFLRTVHYADDSQEEFFSETKDGRDSGDAGAVSIPVPI
jgi:hypothetical protein